MIHKKKLEFHTLAVSLANMKLGSTTCYKSRLYRRFTSKLKHTLKGKNFAKSMLLLLRTSCVYYLCH